MVTNIFYISNKSSLSVLVFNGNFLSIFTCDGEQERIFQKYFKSSGSPPSDKSIARKNSLDTHISFDIRFIVMTSTMTSKWLEQDIEFSVSFFFFPPKHLRPNQNSWNVRKMILHFWFWLWWRHHHLKWQKGSTWLKTPLWFWVKIKC